MNRYLTFLNNYLGNERSRDRLYTALDLFEHTELIDTVKHKSGIYIIMSPSQKFIYPLGASPIIYIGTSNDLHRRLKEHIKYYGIAVEHWKDHTRWIYGRYNYIISYGGKVYYMLTQGRETNKALESKALEGFYDRFGALPVGNGAFSFR